MKKVILSFLLVSTILSIKAVSQSYNPMIKEGANWIMMFGSEDFTNWQPYILRLEGDTSINNMQYKKLLFIDISIENGQPTLDAPKAFGYLREDVSERKVFGFREEGVFDYNVDIWFCPVFGQEQLLYNFGADHGEVAYYCNSNETYINTQLVDQNEFGEDRRVIILGNNNLKLIEGIGFNHGPFNSSIISDAEGHYLNEYCIGSLQECAQQYFERSLGSIVNPNKQWVNAIYDNFGSGGVSSYWLRVNDKVEIVNGELAYKLERTNNEDQSNWELLDNYWLRQDGDKVFYYDNNTPILLYDFSLESGDIFKSQYGDLEVIAIDSIAIASGEKRKIITLRCNSFLFDTYDWIEGIGDASLGLLSPLDYCSTDYPVQLLCHYENDNLVYLNPLASGCWLTGTRDLDYSLLEVFPNPTKNIIYIKNEWTSRTLFKIYNSNREIISQGPLLDDSIDVGQLNSGLFYLEVLDNYKIYYAMFIKQ